MKLNNIIKFDFYFGSLVLILIKHIVFSIGYILKRNHDLKVKGNVVIIKLFGGGSLVIAYASLLSLKNSLKNHKLIFVGTDSTMIYAKELDVFDIFYQIETESLYRLVKSSFITLKNLFLQDTVINLELYSRLSTIFSLLTCARNRIAFHKDDFFWRKHVETHHVYFNLYSGSYYFYDRIIKLLVEKIYNGEDSSIHFQKKFFYKNQIVKSNYLSLAIGCSDLGQERKLDAQQWSMFFQNYFFKSCKEQKLYIKILGTQVDYKLGEEVIHEINNLKIHQNKRIIFENKCGETSFSESLIFIAKSKQFIGIDSGLLHFARLLGIESWSIWGPTAPHTRLRPINGFKDHILYKPVFCSPCIHVTETPPCKGNNICIKSIFDDKDESPIF